MADEADTTDEEVRLQLEARIAARTRYEGTSAFECEECGNTIPEARRLALPGVQLCVECQAAAERRL